MQDGGSTLVVNIACCYWNVYVFVTTRNATQFRKRFGMLVKVKQLKYGIGPCLDDP